MGGRRCCVHEKIGGVNNYVYLEFYPYHFECPFAEPLGQKPCLFKSAQPGLRSEIKNFGDTVKINQVGNVSIKDYTKGTDIDAPEDITGEQPELKIDQAKYFR